MGARRAPPAAGHRDRRPADHLQRRGRSRGDARRAPGAGGAAGRRRRPAALAGRAAMALLERRLRGPDARGHRPRAGAGNRGDRLRGSLPRGCARLPGADAGGERHRAAVPALDASRGDAASGPHDDRRGPPSHRHVRRPRSAARPVRRPRVHRRVARRASAGGRSVRRAGRVPLFLFRRPDVLARDPGARGRGGRTGRVLLRGRAAEPAGPAAATARS
jgi:hypothetical protein